MKIHTGVFWSATPCSLAGRCQRFGETYCLPYQGKPPEDIWAPYLTQTIRLHGVPSVCLSICQPACHLSLPIRPSVYHLSIYLPIYQFIYLSIHPSIHPATYLHLSVCLNKGSELFVLYVCPLSKLCLRMNTTNKSNAAVYFSFCRLQ